MISKNKRLLQRLRVPLGFLLSATFIFFAKPTVLTLAVGGVIATIGILIRGWAAGHIHKFEKLAVTGPYSFTRNPLYLGSFFLAIGFTIAAGVWWLSLITAALFLGIYLPVMRVEESDLEIRFGAEFQEFVDNVPLFFPRPSPWKKIDANFDFQLYLKHREYQAGLGLIFGLCILVAKMFFFSEV